MLGTPRWCQSWPHGHRCATAEGAVREVSCETRTGHNPGASSCRGCGTADVFPISFARACSRHWPASAIRSASARVMNVSSASCSLSAVSVVPDAKLELFSFTDKRLGEVGEPNPLLLPMKCSGEPGRDGDQRGQRSRHRVCRHVGPILKRQACWISKEDDRDHGGQHDRSDLRCAMQPMRSPGGSLKEGYLLLATCKGPLAA